MEEDDITDFIICLSDFIESLEDDIPQRVTDDIKQMGIKKVTQYEIYCNFVE